MSFIHENFMFQNETAIHLYHDYAKQLPIIDYHCHLPPEEIAKDHKFDEMTELWLAGDHYKWRAMRANGVSEELITGSASAREKFKAWPMWFYQGVMKDKFSQERQIKKQ